MVKRYNLKTGITHDDYVLYSDYEIAEAFKPVSIALQKALAISEQRVNELEAVLRNYHRSNCGMSKDCGHEFNCVCPSDAVIEALKENE